MAKYLVGDKAHTMYSYTHTQPGPSSHVHRFIPTASQRKRSQPTQSRDKLHPPHGPQSQRLGRSKSLGATGTAVNRIACPRRPHAHRRFRLLRPRRGSPTVRSLPRFSPFSPFRSKVGANGMSRSLRLLSFHSRSSLTCAGRWQKKGNRFILPGFSFTISKVEAI
jgi:hypothetical protein